MVEIQPASLYGAAFSTLAWKKELQLMASARDAHRRRHSPARFGYQLNGFRLERQQKGRRQDALAGRQGMTVVSPVT